MALEQNKRPRRTPLSSEELATLIAFKKRKEQFKLLALKKSRAYKIQNIFNLLCFFIFCELILCYLGPSLDQKHYSVGVMALRGQEYQKDGTPIVAEIDMLCAHGKTYKFLINDFMQVPPRWTSFIIGKDFLLRKDLKGSFEGSDKTYRIFSASPILFLSVFTSVIILIGIGYNLNENEYSLMGLTIICSMTLLCVLLM